ncbi:MAG: flavodoxin FldA [Spirochaetota bacterium]
MSKIGLFYGSTTGNTEGIVEDIQVKLGGKDVVVLHEISTVQAEHFDRYENLIIACPTWDEGELQSDWDENFNGLDKANFANKKVAYLGIGDQVGYSDTFQDAIGILEEKISGLGGETVGHWPADGYEYTASKAVKNGKFVGLALDEDNQSELTMERIDKWVEQLKSEFTILQEANTV